MQPCLNSSRFGITQIGLKMQPTYYLYDLKNKLLSVFKPQFLPQKNENNYQSHQVVVRVQ